MIKLGDLINFSYKEHDVRTITKDGVAWFIAKDVCECLELNDVRRAIERLDEDEWSLTPLADALGRTQDMYIVNEFGLYNLIMGSRKPEARAFKRWVTHEVLPAIRKDGIYVADDATDPLAALLVSQRQGLEIQKKIFESLQGLNRRITALEGAEPQEIRVVKQSAKEGHRKIFKVEKMHLQDLVSELIHASLSYEAVVDAIKEKTGVYISKSALARYWKERSRESERTEIVTSTGMKLIQEKRFY